MRTYVTARAVILDPDGRMLIIKRSPSDKLHPSTWDLPGGRQDNGESLEETVIREIFEEVGIRLKTPQLVFATSDIREGTSKTWLFYMEIVQSGIPITLSYEHDEHAWIKPEEFPRYTKYEILLRLHEHLMKLRGEAVSG